MRKQPASGLCTGAAAREQMCVYETGQRVTSYNARSGADRILFFPYLKILFSVLARSTWLIVSPPSGLAQMSPSRRDRP